jgi:hypothetical protein
MSNIADELQKLHSLLKIGAITAKEYEQVKAKILSQQQPTESLSQERLLHLELQNELLQINQDWQTEREKYLLYTNDGIPYYEPTTAYVGVMYILGFFAVCLGLWVFPSFQIGGFFMICLAILTPLYTHGKYMQYEEAKTAYMLRRSEIRDKYERKLK